jgi:hypothetical protein
MQSSDAGGPAQHVDRAPVIEEEENAADQIVIYQGWPNAVVCWGVAKAQPRLGWKTNVLGCCGDELGLHQPQQRCFDLS